MEGPGTVAAIVLESIVGTNGVLIPPDGYLAGVRELCDRHGIVMICDEVMVGFGRTGSWFAVDHWGVEPDLISFAKGVNSGYVPLGGVLISDEIAATLRRPSVPGRSRPTRGTRWRAPWRWSRSGSSRRTPSPSERLDLGEQVIRPELEKIAARHPSVGEVRGKGCFFAIELVRDRSHPRAAGAVQRLGRGGGADGRGDGCCEGRRGLALRALQPPARRAAAGHLRGRPAGRVSAAIDRALELADRYSTET